MNNEEIVECEPLTPEGNPECSLTPPAKELVEEIFEMNKKHLDRHYHTGFGIFPSAIKNSNYFNQVWARDSAHASANYFMYTEPKAVIDTLRTFLKHQREDGALPSRVERDYQLIKFIPFMRPYSRKIFDTVEGDLREHTERPVYEGQDFAGGEDTIPAILIQAGELYTASPEGREFVLRHFAQLRRAAEYFQKRTRPKDGLAKTTKTNPDWADTIMRHGKLATINIWWARGLFLLSTIAREKGEIQTALMLQEEYERVKKSILERLYDRDKHYFAATIHDRRLDTVACIFGALYFLDVVEAEKLEEELKTRVAHTSGLQNFDPPYHKKDIYWAHRLMQQWPYHNRFVWPWVTCQNIRVKIWIAREHPDASTRERYHREALLDLYNNAKLFKQARGAVEIFEPDRPEIGRTMFYRPPRNFMASMASYQGAYLKLKGLGWV